jgi:hypothetical protein
VSTPVLHMAHSHVLAENQQLPTGTNAVDTSQCALLLPTRATSAVLHCKCAWPDRRYAAKRLCTVLVAHILQPALPVTSLPSTTAASCLHVPQLLSAVGPSTVTLVCTKIGPSARLASMLPTCMPACRNTTSTITSWLDATAPHACVPRFWATDCVPSRPIKGNAIMLATLDHWTREPAA